jgi:hypothetical protein
MLTIPGPHHHECAPSLVPTTTCAHHPWSPPMVSWQGVNDPASVNTWALENSASIAGSLLTTEALICQRARPQDEEEYVPEFTTDIQEEAAARYAW